MADLSVELTPPNGRTYEQPLGLFINNEFVAAKSGQTIVSINPTYVHVYASNGAFRALGRISTDT